MPNPPKRQLLVNLFGTFGYISLLFQWLWVSVLFLPLLFENTTIKDFFIPPTSVVTTPQLEFHSPPLLASVFAIVITVAVLIVTVVILIRLPMTISKTGKKVTLKSAEKIIPVLTHHRKLPAKQKRQLTIQTIKVLKFVLTLLPFLLLILVAFVPTELPDEVVIFVGALLALLTLLWFTLQYGLARILKVESIKLF